MENRHNLYDPRNTVALSRPGKKNKQRRLRYVQNNHIELKLMPKEYKVAMARECRWCGNTMQEQRAICQFCATCQYCGLIPQRSHYCELCGNDDIDRQPAAIKRIVVGNESPPDEQKNAKRNVRRIGPQTSY